MKFFFILALVFIQEQCYSFFAQKEATDSVVFYMKNNDYLKALNFAEKQSDYYLKNKKYLEYSKIVVQKADIHNTLNNNEKTLKLLFDAIKIIEKVDKIGEIILLRKIGAIYIRLKEYEKAKKYYFTALFKAKKETNDTLIGSLSQPLYKIYMLTDNDSALYYLKKTMTYNKKIGTNGALTTAHNNYFYYYKTIENYKLSKIHLDSSVYYARKTKSREKMRLVLTNLVYYQVVIDSNYNKAKETYQEIFNLSPNDTVSSQVADLYFGYSDLLAKLHEYKLANHYLNKCIDIRDEIYNEKTHSTIRDLEIKYQIDKVEDEFVKKQNILEEKQLKNKKIFFIFLGLFFLSVILFYFFYQNAKLKQKNKLNDIESRVQQNIINATIDGQEIERKKIASVLHDNISAMLSSAGLHLSAFVAGHQAPSEEITKTRAILKETHDMVRDLSHDLVPTLLARFGLFYALQDLCEKNSNSIIQFKCFSEISIKKRYDEDYEMKIYFIITELFNNVIKHSKAKEASLFINEKEKDLLITIEDNGKGFDTDRSKAIEGFGLTQIRARVMNLKGEFTIHSKINSGTTVFIRLPIQF